MKKFFALLVSLSLSSFALTLPLNIAHAAETCEGGECEVVFNKTEQFESWQVPEGILQVDFEVYGAQGGANGGRGGFVSGTLSNLPEQLIIVVGGEGARGANLDGGYNGGGYSGGRDGNPGSGGGASDIRFGTELTDRVVVAGGGGGFGGPVGGSGGAGGGETASDGSAGQGAAGAGGSQISGGAGGRSNSGNTNGASGRFGIGGEGGYTFSGYGGGGGGAGYFGGGGGGADTDTCCLDAGGGGGGSSFANSTYVSNAVFQPGYQSGDGKVILRYSLPPIITDFSYQQTGPLAASVSLGFDSSVTGIEVGDFTVSGCSTAALSGEGQNYTLLLDNCEIEASVAIAANSLGAASNFPASNQLLEIELDQTPPPVTFALPELTNQSTFTGSVETDASGIFDAAGISSENCQLEVLVEQNTANLEFSDCEEGTVAVMFEPSFLADEIGNKSLPDTKSIVVLVDKTAPVINIGDTLIEEVTVDSQQQIRTETQITFSETTLTLDDFTFSGADACQLSSSMEDGTLSLRTIGCIAGGVSWLLPANQLVDPAGNSAPSEDVLIEIVIPEIEATPEPEEVIGQPPVQQPAPAPIFIPAPQPAPAPVQEVTPSPELETEPDSQSQQAEPEVIEPNEPEVEQNYPATEQAPTEIQVQDSQPQVSEPTSEPKQENVQDDALDTEEATELETEPQEMMQEEQTEDQLVASPAIQEQRLGEEESISPWSIAMASMLVLGLLVLVIYLTKNNRARSIK